MRTRVRIIAVCAGFMRDHAGVKLFFEFPPHFGDTLLGLFGKFLRGGAVLYAADGLTHLVFKVADERFDFALKFARLSAAAPAGLQLPDASVRGPGLLLFSAANARSLL